MPFPGKKLPKIKYGTDPITSPQFLSICPCLLRLAGQSIANPSSIEHRSSLILQPIDAGSGFGDTSLIASMQQGPPFMEFCVLNEEVERLEAVASHGPGLPGWRAMAALAWHLRQRDTTRALELANQVSGALDWPDWPAAEADTLRARLQLVQGEALWLDGEFEAASQHAERALAGFNALSNPIGAADACWLLGWIAVDQGDSVQRDQVLGRMLALVRSIDPIRANLAQAVLARSSVFREPHSAKQRFAHYYQACQTDARADPASCCAVSDLLGVIEGLNSDYAQAAFHFAKSYTHAMATGQIRCAIVTAGNLGDSLANLSEYHTALDWMQRGLDLARQHGWPGPLGVALLQTAKPLRRLQRFDAARELLVEALSVMSPMSGSRNFAVALDYLGDVELDSKQYQHALVTFRLLEQRAEQLAQPDLQGSAWCGQAHALLHLGQPLLARHAANRALAIGGVELRIACLRIMAEIHGTAPELADTPNHTPLHFLHQALELAGSIEGYAMPGDMLDTIAREYARIGNYQQAYQFAASASLAHEKTHSQEATQRVIALQVNHQTERARAESEYHRQLAQAEAKRAGILQETGITLERLGSIGQEITAHLELAQIFDVLQRHVHHLLDTHSMVIYLLDESGLLLDQAFGLEDNRPLPGNRIALTQADSKTAECVRERREILVDYTPEQTSDNLLPGTEPNLSALFAPLILADQVLGAITIQSLQRHAYGNREQLIFRSLCAYTAIALSNASTHGKLAAANRHLQETQQQLVLQEKMVALGTLTAGVGHEINNPTNFAHVAAQNLRIDLRQFEQILNELTATEAEPRITSLFQQHFSRLQQHVATILDGTGRIKGIVQDLRAFTRADSSEKQLLQISSCLLSTLNLVRTSWLEQVEFVTEFADDPAILCWPALINQAFMNLLVNGCQAIAETLAQREPGARGCLRLTCRCDGPWLAIDFIDNGIGIPEANLAHVLEPFFTTKQVGVGTGLGLAITYNIIKKHDGQLSFSSTPGAGSCFSVKLPLHPEPQ
jgi:signal transduction histidine kinase